MNKHFFRLLYSLLLGAILFFSIESTSNADTEFRHMQTRCQAIIRDDANLLSEEEEENLLSIMKRLTKYTSAAFVTTEFPYDSAEICAQDYYEVLFDNSFSYNENCILFLMDLYHYELLIYTHGEIDEFIDEEYISSINELSYYLTISTDYYDCARVVFEDIYHYIIGDDVSSEANYISPDTGYRIIINDDSDLLTDSEEDALRETMKKITAYGNVAFVSTDQASYSSEETAWYQYVSLFGTSSGVLFLVDMDNRYLQIYSDGAIYERVNTDYANTITDNVYKLASDEKYFECANEAFTQIFTILEGGKIAQPMKYICNIILGLIIAVSINFWWISHYARVKRPKNKEILATIAHSFNYSTPTYVYTHDTKEKRESSGGGGYRGGGYRGGGGRVGGGRSGGGGGHRF